MKPGCWRHVRYSNYLKLLIAVGLQTLTLLLIGTFEPSAGFSGKAQGIQQFYAFYAPIFLVIFAMVCCCRVPGKRWNGFYDIGRKVLFDSPLWAFLLILTVGFFIVALKLAFVWYQGQPLVVDAVLQAHHARYIAQGYWLVPIEWAPPVDTSPDTGHSVYDRVRGVWYSHFPPGNLLILVLGYALGISSAMGPLLSALTIPAMYWLAVLWWNARVARVAALLLATSPFFMYMSFSYMNHIPALLSVTLGMAGYLHILRTRHYWSACVCGAGFGMLLITRPYTAVLMALPFVVYSMLMLWRQGRRYVLPFVASLAVALCFLCFQLWYNNLTTGNPFIYAYVAAHGTEVLPQLGKDPYGNEHTLARGVGFLFTNLIGLNFFLFRWPIPCMLGIAIACSVPGFWKGIGKWLIASMLSLWIGYVFFYFQDFCFGPRYAYEAMPIYIIATAYAVVHMPGWLGSMGCHTPLSQLRQWTAYIMLVLFVAGIPLWSAAQTSVFEPYCRPGGI